MWYILWKSVIVMTTVKNNKVDCSLRQGDGLGWWRRSSEVTGQPLEPTQCVFFRCCKCSVVFLLVTRIVMLLCVICEWYIHAHAFCPVIVCIQNTFWLIILFHYTEAPEWKVTLTSTLFIYGGTDQMCYSPLRITNLKCCRSDIVYCIKLELHHWATVAFIVLW